MWWTQFPHEVLSEVEREKLREKSEWELFATEKREQGCPAGAGRFRDCRYY